MKYDFVILGAAGVDTNVYLRGDEIDWEHEANFSENKDFIGGAGGYASRIAAQLGYYTAFSGFLGDDKNAAIILDGFAHDGIETKVFIDPQGTKRSVNIMFKDGRRKNFYDAKSTHLIPELSQLQYLLTNTRIVHVNISNWTRYALPLMKSTIISVDLQDLHSFNDDYIQDYMKYADVIFASCVNLDNPVNEFRSVSKKHPGILFIGGNGSEGVIIARNERIQKYRVPDINLPVFDTNGAGDSIAIGFLSGRFIEGLNESRAIELAQIIAKYTCATRGASKFYQMSHYKKEYSYLFKI